MLGIIGKPYQMNHLCQELNRRPQPELPCSTEMPAALCLFPAFVRKRHVGGTREAILERCLCSAHALTLKGNSSPWSNAHVLNANPICFRLLTQFIS